ncbi:hypothetical protein ACFL0V_02595 [Nanoarchaeota archaeon]
MDVIRLYKYGLEGGFRKYIAYGRRQVLDQTSPDDNYNMRRLGNRIAERLDRKGLDEFEIIFDTCKGYRGVATSLDWTEDEMRDIGAAVKDTSFRIANGTHKKQGSATRKLVRAFLG